MPAIYLTAAELEAVLAFPTYCKVDAGRLAFDKLAAASGGGTKPRGRPAKADRNAAIHAARAEGLRLHQIAARFGISTTRVASILRQSQRHQPE